jgi:hypothetical protein
MHGLLGPLVMLGVMYSYRVCSMPQGLICPVMLFYCDYGVQLHDCAQNLEMQLCKLWPANATSKLVPLPYTSSCSLDIVCFAERQSCSACCLS